MYPRYQKNRICLAVPSLHHDRLFQMFLNFPLCLNSLLYQKYQNCRLTQLFLNFLLYPSFQLFLNFLLYLSFRLYPRNPKHQVNPLHHLFQLFQMFLHFLVSHWYQRFH